MNKRIVTVFGSSRPQPDDDRYATAYAVGRCVAQLGLTLCNGGYGGTMEAAARGAAEAGGDTIGVTCPRLGRGGPNPYIRQEVPTFDLLQRLNTLLRLGRAYVVLPGGTGTLAELSLAWELTNKRLIGNKPRPLILFGDAWRPVVETVTRSHATPTKPAFVRDVDELRQALAAVECFAAD